VEAISVRDREVMALVVRDLLDPSNPAYELDSAAKLLWPGEIVLNSVTTALDFIGQETVDQVAEDYRLSGDVRARWKVRNSGDVGAISEFRIEEPRVRVANLDELDKEATARGMELWTLFESKYPNASYLFCPYLPGFSTDGKSALVTLYAGPSVHGVVWAYYLERSRQSQWKIVWRFKKVWE
jgi:hypothetical protein